LDFSSSVEYVTGQAIDLKTPQDHNATAEGELDTLRSKVDELTDEVGAPLLFPMSLLTQHLVSSGINSVTRLINRLLRSALYKLSRKPLLLCRRILGNLVKRWIEFHRTFDCF
jgi:hypothetical protein